MGRSHRAAGHDPVCHGRRAGIGASGCHHTYEANGAKKFALFAALLSVGCFAVAGVLRDRPGAALAVLVVFGVPLAVTAVLIPRWMKRWYEKNRRLVELHDQQRTGQGGPPPPPPPGSPDGHPHAGDGQ